MRCLALLATALLLCVSAGRADSLSDLRQPSSTIPGCVNDWGPLGTGSGVVEPTCEGKAALAEWNEHAAAVNTARDLLVQASDLPDRAEPQAVVNALNACAAAADAMTRLYHPAEPRPRGLADVLACEGRTPPDAPCCWTIRDRAPPTHARGWLRLPRSIEGLLASARSSRGSHSAKPL